MKTYQNALLAGVAALALVAGTGFASAQQQPNGQSTAPKAGQMHAAHPTLHSGMQAQSHGRTGMTAQNAHQGARPNAKGATGGMQQNANMGKKGPEQNASNGKQGAQQTANGKQGKQPSMAQKAGPESSKQNQASNTMEHRNRHMARSEHMREHMRHGRQSTAQREREMRNRRMTAQREHEQRGHQTTAQRERGLHGLQANASGQMQRVQTSSGTNVRLSEQQRTRIRETIINGHNAPRVGHVNFSVNVGTVIPREEFTTIHVVPVPEYLVRIDPRWRGLEYFIFSDEVVIVNPHNLRIIAIVPV